MNKEYIFKNEKHILKYKELIIKKLEESKIEILAYCIMNNHAHFIIWTEKIEYLSKYMQRLNTSYGRFYNNLTKRLGFVFRNRYCSQGILTSKQLYNCLAYVQNNPVKAKMVKNMEEYRYSSYNEFLGNREIITEEGIKILFGRVKDYKEQFINIHKNSEEFIDIKEKSIVDYIKDVEGKYFEKHKNKKTSLSGLFVLYYFKFFK